MKILQNLLSGKQLLFSCAKS